MFEETQTVSTVQSTWEETDAQTESQRSAEPSSGVSAEFWPAHACEEIAQDLGRIWPEMIRDKSAQHSQRVPTGKTR